MSLSRAVRRQLRGVAVIGLMAPPPIGHAMPMKHCRTRCYGLFFLFMRLRNGVLARWGKEILRGWWLKGVGKSQCPPPLNPQLPLCYAMLCYAAHESLFLPVLSQWDGHLLLLAYLWPRCGACVFGSPPGYSCAGIGAGVGIGHWHGRRDEK